MGLPGGGVVVRDRNAVALPKLSLLVPRNLVTDPLRLPGRNSIQLFLHLRPSRGVGVDVEEEAPSALVPLRLHSRACQDYLVVYPASRLYASMVWSVMLLGRLTNAGTLSDDAKS